MCTNHTCHMKLVTVPLWFVYVSFFFIHWFNYITPLFLRHEAYALVQYPVCCAIILKTMSALCAVVEQLQHTKLENQSYPGKEVCVVCICLLIWQSIRSINTLIHVDCHSVQATNINRSKYGTKFQY